MKAYYLNDDSKTQLSVSEDNNSKIIEVGTVSADDNLSVIVVEYENTLNIEDPVIIPNKKGNVILRDNAAIKHGKYGMKSYRSIIKDYYRTWDISLEEDVTYEMQIIYRMKYDQKDFKIKVGDQELAFTLSGKAPEKPEVEELFDGNETAHTDDSKSSLKYGKAIIGDVTLKEGIHTVVFSSGKEFEFKTTLEEFHKQDRKYRGLNIDTPTIRFMKK